VGEKSSAVDRGAAAVNHPVRAFLFRHYWWITTLVVLAAIPLIITVSRPDTVTGTLLRFAFGALGVVYFVQKQKLEEVQLFERLFTRFNERYAVLNDNLQAVRSGTVQDSAEVRRVLDDYFNLCAEEYLFFEQGESCPRSGGRGAGVCPPTWNAM